VLAEQPRIVTKIMLVGAPRVAQEPAVRGAHRRVVGAYICELPSIK
jgi:hypothetical protein